MMPTEGTIERKAEVSAIFEGMVDHYDLERENMPYFRAQLSIVLSMLEGEKGRILVIGCAAGGEMDQMLKRGFSAIGIDLAPGMVRFARRRFADSPGADFCQADVEKLPFASSSVDHVVCLGVFEFLPEYTAGLEEIRRVLRPDGLVVFAIPSRVSLYSVSERAARAVLGPIWRGAKRLLGKPRAVGTNFTLNRCVPSRFRRLLNSQGFEVKRSRYSNFFVYPLEYVEKLNITVARILEPLGAVPGLRTAGHVFLISARKK